MAEDTAARQSGRADAQREKADGVSNLRRRLLERQPSASGDSDHGQSSPAFGRRTSSFTSNSSYGGGRRGSVRSSTDDLFVPRATGEREELHQEPDLWHSAPLLFAIIPALGGVLFKKGTAYITDIILLIMATFYLNWCLVTPWIWYHASQTIKVAKPPVLDTITEEDQMDGQDESAVKSGDETQTDDPASPTAESKPRHHARNAALHELQLHELAALFLCFAGPLVGAYVLHLVRDQLSRFSDELVSNLHLTLFVLGAELRPLRHSIKLVQARTLHLQKVVREDPYSSVTPSTVNAAELETANKRIDELESVLAETLAENSATRDSALQVSAEQTRKAQASLQTQVDALNRAVRRYEKRAASQSVSTETRLTDLESRVRDSLSLAAAAASYSQKPGTFSSLLERARIAVTAPLFVGMGLAVLPFQKARDIFMQFLYKLGLARPARRTTVSKRRAREMGVRVPPSAPSSSSSSRVDRSAVSGKFQQTD